MLTTLRNAWKIVDLRKKIFFTLLIVLLYRIGNVIPVPFVNVENMAAMFDQKLSGTILDMINMMSGNAFSMATIFALGIQPYIKKLDYLFRRTFKQLFYKDRCSHIR